jgi:hypothetical protein
LKIFPTQKVNNGKNVMCKNCVSICDHFPEYLVPEKVK